MLSEKGSILFLSDPGKSLETQRRRSIMPFPVGRNDTKHRVTETQSFVFLSTAHRVYGLFVCGEAADSVVPLVIFLQTVTGLCVSVFNINYTLCGLEWCISTLPALHVLTSRTPNSFQLRTSGSFQLPGSFQLRTSGSFQLRTSGSFQLRTSGSFQLRTSDSFQPRMSDSYWIRTSDSFQPRMSDSYWIRTFASFQPRTIGNLEEVELWVTAGGSPKGNTCGLPHLSSFSHVDLEGVEPRLFCQKEPFITTNELEQLFTEIAPLMSLSLVHDVLRHYVLPGHRGCSRA